MPKFSIGFISGLSGGVRNQLIPLLMKKSWAEWEVCLGSLSCINLCTLGGGNFASIKDRRVFSRILYPQHTYLSGSLLANAGPHMYLDRVLSSRLWARFFPFFPVAKSLMCL